MSASEAVNQPAEVLERDSELLESPLTAAAPGPAATLPANGPSRAASQVGRSPGRPHLTSHHAGAGGLAQLSRCELAASQ